MYQTVKTFNNSVSTSFKTAKSKRIVPIPSWLSAMVKNGNGMIFTRQAETYRHKLNKYIEKSGNKRITPHGFRHSYAAMLIYKGIDMYTLKEILGHENISMTMDTYAHLYDQKRNQISDLFETSRSQMGVKINFYSKKPLN